MKVYLDHSIITQNMHGASRNYRYVLDVSLSNCSRRKSTRGAATHLRCVHWIRRKCNTSHFPIHSKMVRDILPILVSIVAFESGFSTSGGILDHFRSSLTPATLQALICTQTG